MFEAPQIEREIARMLIPVPGLLRQSFGQDFIQFRRLMLQRRWRIVEDCAHCFHARFAPEWTVAREHLVQNNAQ